MTATLEKIKGVPVTAPLFKTAPAEDLAQIVDHLSSASYHFADDSAKEWGTARERLKKAAEIVNRHQLCSRAIAALHGHTPQLFSLDDFLDAVLAGCRS